MDPLLEQAARNEGDARDQLVRQFSDRLRLFIERDLGARVRREVSGSDLVQDVFLEVFRSLHSMPEGSTLETFWGRLRRNASWIIARRAKRSADFGNVQRADPAAEEETTGEVTRGDELRMLRELIARLDPKYGDVVRLRLEGKRFAEIGTQLHEREDTVRKRFERAYAALERLVKRPDEDVAG